MAYPKDSKHENDDRDAPAAPDDERGAEVEYGLDDEHEPLSLAEEIAAEGDCGPAMRSTIATSRSSSPATPTSPNSSGCRWPS